MIDRTREREFWILIRQAILLMVDAIERRLDIHPRTAELRKEARGQQPDRGE